VHNNVAHDDLPPTFLSSEPHSVSLVEDAAALNWQAIYFGNAHWHGNTGLVGPDPENEGPWAGADLEQGMY
jgi:hypothetical protein